MRVAKVAALFLAGRADRESLRAAVEDWDRLALLPDRTSSGSSQGDLLWGGGGGLPAVEEPAQRSRTPRRQRVSRTSERSEEPKGTWLSSYGKAWTETYEGIPAYGILAKALGELHKRFGEEEVLRRWKNYLKSTPARFASPFRFAQTFGAWTVGTTGQKGDWLEQRAGEDIDAYIGRLSKGKQ